MVNMTVIHSCMYDDNAKVKFFGNTIVVFITLVFVFHSWRRKMFLQPRHWEQPLQRLVFEQCINSVAFLTNQRQMIEKYFRIIPNFISFSGWQHVAWFCVWLCEGSLKEGWNTWQIWSLWDLVTIRWITRLWR